MANTGGESVTITLSLFYVMQQIKFILWIIAIILITLLAARHVLGDQYLPLAIVSYLFTWIFFSTVLFFIIVSLLRDKYLIIVWFTLTCLMGIKIFPTLPPFSTSTPPENTFTVMTYSLSQKNEDVPGIITVIRSESPDIVAVQELNSKTRQGLIDYLTDNYPYHAFSSSNETCSICGEGIISRYPVRKVSQLSIFEVDLPDGTLTIFNLHVAPPYDWHEQRFHLLRSFQGLQYTDKPFLLLGDFNLTDQSENYHMIPVGLTDSFLDSGSGFGFTYPTMDLYFS
ncbi:MAG: hypothetical protein B6242_05030 [Anaerolineaceae bacterium 4572_78]|nr:MAG: hypothetical protein B6242_05030 [Anaerolineaceae bacterium 4572_78]